MQNKAIPFIKYSDKGQYFISEEGIDLLQNNKDQQVSIISIIGQQKSGKSFFLNKCLLKDTNQQAISPPIFETGFTINQCTKGLWIYDATESFKNISKQNQRILIIDSEGLGSISQNQNHDMIICTLAILISSYICFNTMGNLEENSINHLGTIINMVKKLSQQNNQELQFQNQTFLWLLRDFTLQLQDSIGNPISTKQYLENALQEKKGLSESTQNKNQIRKLFKLFFPDRDCMTLSNPIDNEEDLRKIESGQQRIEDLDLSVKFLQQSEQIQNKIQQKLKPLQFQGQSITGNQLLCILQQYLKQINQGQLPHLNTVWDNLVQQEIQQKSEQLMQNFSEKLEEYLQQTIHITKASLKSFKKNLKQSLKTQFYAQNISEKEQIQPVYQKLKENLKKIFKQKLDDHKQKILQKIKQNLTNLDKKLENFDPPSLEEFESYFDSEKDEFGQKILNKLKNEYLIKYVKLIKRNNQDLQFNDKFSEILTHFEQKELKITQLQHINLEKDQIIQKQLIQIQNLAKNLEDKNQKLQKSAQNTEKILQQNENLTHQNNFLYQNNEKLQKELEIVQNQLQEQQKIHENIQNQKINLIQDLEDKETHIIQLSEKNSDQKVQNQILAQKVQDLEYQIEFTSEQLLENRNMNNTLLSTVNQGLNSTVEGTNKVINLTNENQQLSQKISDLETEIQILELKCENGRNYKKMLKNTLKIQCKLCEKVLKSEDFKIHYKICKNQEKQDQNIEQQYDVPNIQHHLQQSYSEKPQKIPTNPQFVAQSLQNSPIQSQKKVRNINISLNATDIFQDSTQKYNNNNNNNINLNNFISNSNYNTPNKNQNQMQMLMQKPQIQQNQYQPYNSARKNQMQNIKQVQQQQQQPQIKYNNINNNTNTRQKSSEKKRYLSEEKQSFIQNLKQFNFNGSQYCSLNKENMIQPQIQILEKRNSIKLPISSSSSSQQQQFQQQLNCNKIHQ